ncbi:hypothetical protein BVRB_034360 [Beta vulgaris subsp. vulgaris]|uniref:Uncharacterized protein n=1 Tax=Beta vulgaris subsp. vulgaris TaxID=3555 RepID=A0A0J7YQA1_BETVV|nr:hypothetical protein BVRB_034360 [Beta vulgaris subsp. vulgaris]
MLSQISQPFSLSSHPLLSPLTSSASRLGGPSRDSTTEQQSIATSRRLEISSRWSKNLRSVVFQIDPSKPAMVVPGEPSSFLSKPSSFRSYFRQILFVLFVAVRPPHCSPG